MSLTVRPHEILPAYKHHTGHAGRERFADWLSGEIAEEIQSSVRFATAECL
jgi:hypothetical protein